MWGGGGGSGEEGSVGGGGVRVDVIEELKFLGKFTKKIGGGGRVCVGDQGGCERNIEVFVKIKKKTFFFFGGGGGRVGRVRVDVNKELKFWGKFTKIKSGGGGGQGGYERNVGGRG